jgi:MORN repeat.
MQGLGEAYWPDEKEYYGEWMNDKMHGNGHCL